VRSRELWRGLADPFRVEPTLPAISMPDSCLAKSRGLLGVGLNASASAWGVGDPPGLRLAQKAVDPLRRAYAG
jgi:hypothetical protein